MTSAVEQLAANFSWRSFAKADDLKKRLLFTLGALVVYRVGTYVPIPGIDPQALEDIFSRHSGGIMGMFDMFSGGALGRMTIFALNIMPYITASIIMQLLTSMVPRLEAMKKEGESGRKQINQYTRYATVALAAVQSYWIAVGLEAASVGAGAPVVIDSGLMFRLSAVVSLVGGTMFLMWLGEQVTRRGIGNGISLIIFSGIVANLPAALASTLELGRIGALSTFLVIFLFVMAIGVLAGIVWVERAQRRLAVQYPKRQAGNRMYAAQSSHLPIKINVAGVIPPIFASSILLMPLTLASFNSEQMPDWLREVSSWLSHGQPLYLLLYVVMIVFFDFFYTSVVFNPADIADQLKRNNGYIPGFRPGEQTSSHIGRVLNRLTVIGAAYLSVVCILPEILISQYRVPFYFGGTSLLIVVSVSMDTLTQIQSQLFAHQYEGLLRQMPGGRRGKGQAASSTSRARRLVTGRGPGKR